MNHIPEQADISDWNKTRYELLSRENDNVRVPITLLNPSTSPAVESLSGKFDFAMVRSDSNASSEYFVTEAGQFKNEGERKLKVGHSSIVRTLDPAQQKRIYGAGTLKIKDNVIT